MKFEENCLEKKKKFITMNFITMRIIGNVAERIQSYLFN